MIADGDYPCDHGRKCLIECPPCGERREREERLSRLKRRPRLHVIEGDGAQSTKQFRKTLQELKDWADKAGRERT